MSVVPPDGSLSVTAGAAPTLLVSGNEGGSTAVGDGGFDKPFAVLICKFGKRSVQARIAIFRVSSATPIYTYKGYLVIPTNMSGFPSEIIPWQGEVKKKVAKEIASEGYELCSYSCSFSETGRRRIEGMDLEPWKSHQLNRIRKPCIASVGREEDMRQNFGHSVVLLRNQVHQKARCICSRSRKAWEPFLKTRHQRHWVPSADR